ncbi:MAG: hypothetical protein IMZ71_00660 [Chloroflexi bacterium]|nr:hypothetical protein [Chloroflexota bacterium]
MATTTSIADGAWVTGAKWDTGNVPTALDDTIVAHALTDTAGTLACLDLTINVGKGLVGDTTTQLKVWGDAVIDGTLDLPFVGELEFLGFLTAGATANFIVPGAGLGMLSIAGSAHTITCNGVRLPNLIIEPAVAGATYTLTDDLFCGTLKLTTGTGVGVLICGTNDIDCTGIEMLDLGDVTGSGAINVAGDIEFLVGGWSHTGTLTMTASGNLAAAAACALPVLTIDAGVTASVTGDSTITAITNNGVICIAATKTLTGTLAFGAGSFNNSGILDGASGASTNTSAVVIGGTVNNVDLTGQTALLHLYPAAASAGGNVNVTELSPLIQHVLGLAPV